MAISDSTYRTLEAQGTTGSTIVKSALLGLVIALTQHSYPRVDLGESLVSLGGTEETFIRQSMVQVTEMDLLAAMSRVHNVLYENQIELDPDSKRILYSNLWDLYT